MARPKSKRGQKLHVAFRLHEEDKERALRMAEKRHLSLSAYVNLAVLKLVEVDEKSED